MTPPAHEQPAWHPDFNTYLGEHQMLYTHSPQLGQSIHKALDNMCLHRNGPVDTADHQNFTHTFHSKSTLHLNPISAQPKLLWRLELHAEPPPSLGLAQQHVQLLACCHHLMPACHSTVISKPSRPSRAKCITSSSWYAILTFWLSSPTPIPCKNSKHSARLAETCAACIWCKGVGLCAQLPASHCQKTSWCTLNLTDTYMSCHSWCTQSHQLQSALHCFWLWCQQICIDAC